MNAFIQNLSEELAARLSEVPEGIPLINQYNLKCAFVQQTLVAIKNYMSNYRFSSLEEEIEFFKKFIPDIRQQEILYTKLADLEVEKESMDSDGFRDFLNEELMDVKKFLLKKKFLYAYYLKGESDLDAYFFTIRNASADFNGSIMGTVHSLVIAQIKALEKYRSLLHVELKVVGESSGSLSDEVIVEFVGTDADIAEIVPAVHRLKLIRVNGKEATQDELLEIIDKMFKRDVKRNFSVVDNKNRARKKSQVPFMERLIEAYMQRSRELLK